jgi:septal ring factor EnvC (AmiA/AmiB activator)
MKTLDETYQDSLKKIEEVGTINEITAEIMRVTDALKKAELKNWSADQISRAITTLAVLRVNLGAEMADASSYYDFAYISRKIQYASEWKPTKDALNKTLARATVQDIDSAITGKIADLMNRETEIKHLADKLKVIYDSTETLITALQSRLGVLKQERAESRY